MTFLKKVISPFICVAFIAPLSMASAQNKPLDHIEAVVNQEVILSSDIKRMQASIVERYQKGEQTLPNNDELQRQVLDKLITDRLQLQIAERIGLRIEDAQLDQTLQQIASEQNLTMQQLKERTINQGSSFDAFVDSVRDELTINEVRQIQVRRRINISDQEVEQMVKRLNEHGAKNTQFHLAHIMLKVTNQDTEETQKSVNANIKELALKVNSGESIHSLAVQYSQGPRATEGGDWGWLTADEMPSIFADKFHDKKMKKGDLIGPFKSDMGIHLIKILNKKGNESVITVEVNARHILIKSNIILSDDKAEQMLKEFRKEILAGTKDFSELATAHSQDPGSAVKGGDLGWADPSMYVPEFKDRSLSMEVGEISQPFLTMHGWHILQVMDKRESDTTEGATKQKAYSILFKQRFPAEVYAWMNEIRQEAYIKISNPALIMDDN